MFLLAAAALAAAPFELPADEDTAAWAYALELAGFVAGATGDGPAAELREASGTWQLTVRDRAGRLHVVTVPTPSSNRAREDIAWTAQSLLDPVVPTLGEGARAIPAGPPDGVGARSAPSPTEVSVRDHASTPDLAPVARRRTRTVAAREAVTATQTREAALAEPEAVEPVAVGSSAIAEAAAVPGPKGVAEDAPVAVPAGVAAPLAVEGPASALESVAVVDDERGGDTTGHQSRAPALAVPEPVPEPVPKKIPQPVAAAVAEPVVVALSEPVVVPPPEPVAVAVAEPAVADAAAIEPAPIETAAPSRHGAEPAIHALSRPGPGLPVYARGGGGVLVREGAAPAACGRVEAGVRLGEWSLGPSVEGRGASTLQSDEDTAAAGLSVGLDAGWRRAGRLAPEASATAGATYYRFAHQDLPVGEACVPTLAVGGGLSYGITSAVRVHATVRGRYETRPLALRLDGAPVEGWSRWSVEPGLALSIELGAPGIPRHALRE